MGRNKTQFGAEGVRLRILTGVFKKGVCCMIGLLFFWFSGYAQEEQFKYDSKGKRNPFIPLVTSDGRLIKLKEEEEKKAEFALEGIVYSQYGISYAIFNGEVVKVGDKIGESQVLKIEERRVILIKDGQISETELKKEEF
jgi:hypothetical protein